MNTCAHTQTELALVPHDPVPLDEKQRAVQQWRALADEQDHAAALGITHPNIARVNADLYRRTARSIEVEIETGTAVCVCCFKPFGRGALTH
ncbi:hypothetical protein KTD28_06080 [Burkholderia gladioli]|uniref:hypothetical protein n=1 Tax=Burkholderia gladioli TaxID=28095 RepID=UPI000F520DAE|nr:hypothetical protein [Burkholderia gladioli]MBU9154175.1 hypothetical protein [Burkholderia gladioli]MCH7275003.1 hypothetical protein [Burkholderia gladioli]